MIPMSTQDLTTCRNAVSIMNMKPQLDATDAQLMLGMLNSILARFPEVMEKPKRKAVNHKITEDWMPAPETIRWATEKHPEVNLDDEAEQFRNHFLSVGGPKSFKSNWDRAFRNWIIRSKNWSSGAKPSRSDERRNENRSRITGAALSATVENPLL